MNDLTPEAAASFLEQYARRLHGTTSLKWTGEFDPAAGVEARLVLIAAGLRGGETASHPRPGENDALFLRGQAETLRGPNRLILDDPMITTEWRQVSEDSFQMADRLESIAELIVRLSP